MPSRLTPLYGEISAELIRVLTLLGSRTEDCLKHATSSSCTGEVQEVESQAC